MSLETIIDGIAEHLSKPFITVEERYRAAHAHARKLKPQHLSRPELHGLDDLALTLKQQSYRHDSPALDNMIRHIDSLRKPYRENNAETAYAILTQKGSTYTNRFRALTDYLAHHDAGYDDLRLVKHRLDTDRYLRRKERALQGDRREDDAYFSAKNELQRTLDASLIAHELRKEHELNRPQRRVNWAYTGALAATAVCLVLVGVPTPVYLALL